MTPVATPLILNQPLSAFTHIGATKAKLFEKLGIFTVEDLLTHFPTRYEDRRQFPRFPTEASDEATCVRGIVLRATVKRLRSRQTMFEVVLQEPEGHALSAQLTARWFNAYYVHKMIVPGQQIVFYGKPKKRGAQIVMDHPEFEILDETDTEASIHLERIAPVYAATAGLSQRVLRTCIYHTLPLLDGAEVTTILPTHLDSTIDRKEALKNIHFPPDETAKAAAYRHLVLTEFFSLQLHVAAKRAQTIAQPGKNHCGEGKLLDQFLKSLPFALTKAQAKAIEEIRSDLQSQQPMNRLLQGDVGAGKTLVALAAMLLTVEAGYQAVLMAPTQILAQQHYLVFSRWLKDLKLAIALRTSAHSEGTGFASHSVADPTQGKLDLSFDYKTEPDIIVGTHALLYEKNTVSRLGLAVIDEQHKFGVMQRAALIHGKAPAPDVLVMTATPIPRTLAITVYGDLDSSILNERPAGRGTIISAVRPSEKLPQATEFIRDQLKQGRQAYLVYPLIEESEKLANTSAAMERFRYWSKALHPFRVGLLHGQLDPAEKEITMQQFREGSIQALVSTTVIEVGVDVSNANLMLIENAERFGLAQLHQLRGRIGRGEHKSYCILMTGPKINEESLEKLKVLESTNDGFAIAEADLRLRGPGDILGTDQSGLPPLKLGNLMKDAEWMRICRDAAKAIFAADPHLQAPENQKLNKHLSESHKQAHVTAN